MKRKYQTFYKTSYGTVVAMFKEEMTFEQAEKLGKEYCRKKGHEYIKTEENGPSPDVEK